METSTRLAFVLGDFRVNASELTAEEWFVIVKKAMELITPQLGSLPDFGPLNDCLNHTEHFAYQRGCSRGYDRWVTDEVSLPASIFRETQCSPIATLSRSPNFSQIDKNIKPLEEGEKRILKQRILLLTDQGVWLDWDAEQLLRFEGDKPYRIIVARSVVSRIRKLLQDDDFAAILTPEVGQQILRRLVDMANADVSSAKSVFVQKKSVSRTLAAMLHRVNDK